MVKAWMQRGIGILTVVAVVGSPSVAAACVALCAPSTADGAADPSHHGGHAVAHDRSGHHHEPVDTGLDASVSNRDCCTHSVEAGKIDVTRRATRAFLATTSPAASAVTTHVSITTERYGSTIPPPSPRRAPLVLLI